MTPEFDFAAWADRARRFMTALEDRPGFELDAWSSAPPLTPAEASGLTQQLGRELPAALRGFLELGAGAVAGRYTLGRSTIHL